MTVSGNSQTVYSGGAISLTGTADVEMNHRHLTGGKSTVNANGSFGVWTPNYPQKDSYTDYVNLRHRHSLTFTPSVSMGNGDTETRPNNYTVKIWKRIN